MTSTQSAPSREPAAAKGGILGRQLGHYPANGPRLLYLGVTVMTTVVLYYQLYTQGAVVTQITTDLHMTLAYYIAVSVVGAAAGALASVAAGLGDRWGRANLVVGGLGMNAFLIFFGLPQAGSKSTYLVIFALVSVVEGIVLVATPALIRDFSPQLGRAWAMGFWTMGPVLGSLVVTEVATHTLDSHPDWQFQFRVAGVVSFVAFGIAFVFLRELAPQLRDQLMVSLKDKTLIEARARGIDPERALEGHWRQMLRFDIIGSALAVALFLAFYYVMVGFVVAFFATTYGYSEARANALANWFWISEAIALVVAGALSDKLRVRKPFMLLGGLISCTGLALFAVASGDRTTSYYHFVALFLVMAIGIGIAFASWMAAFTETVEKHNPAATATGLAIWGATVRTVVCGVFLAMIFALPAASTLIDKGPRVKELATGTDPALSTSQNAAVKAVAADPGIVTTVQSLATKYSAELATAGRLTPATSVALAANPNDTRAQVAALAQISGLPLATVAKTLSLSAKYTPELATAATIDAATKAALLANPADTAAQQKAVADIAVGLKVDVPTAVASLQALGAVPKADLVFVATNGAKVQQASTQLQALGKVPAADLAYLTRYGTALKDPKVVAALTYLKTEAPRVQKAVKDGPGQWQRWWWICFACMVVFLPSVWLLTGRWSPAKAAMDAKEHDDLVDRELAALPSAGTA